jgi:hypothetical protein
LALFFGKMGKKDKKDKKKQGKGAEKTALKTAKNAAKKEAKQRKKEGNDEEDIEVRSKLFSRFISSSFQYSFTCICLSAAVGSMTLEQPCKPLAQSCMGTQAPLMNDSSAPIRQTHKHTINSSTESQK